MSQDLLLVELRQFAEKLAKKNIRLVVGGGYGLLLKAIHIQRNGTATRLPQTPAARSTGDIDVFLTSEVIIDTANMTAVRQALDEMGYKPVIGAEYYQFFREVNPGQSSLTIKFDFLAAPILGDKASKVRVDDRRIKPRVRATPPIHAHTTPEALTLEEHLLGVNVGDAGNSVEIFLPHPFSYLLLKLFALRDLLNDEQKDFGRNHAFDIYLTWAMMTEQEFAQAEDLRAKYSQHAVLAEASEIVRELFADENAKGMIRLREHVRREDIQLMEIDAFIADFKALLGLKIRDGIATER